MNQEVIIAIVTALSTLVGSGIISNYVANRRINTDAKDSQSKNAREDFESINETWKADNDRLRAEIVLLEKEIDKLKDSLLSQKEMFLSLLEEERKKNVKIMDNLRDKIREEEKKRDDLATKLILFETSHHDLPLPQWLKDLNGVMLSLNDAYEETFLKPIGKRRSDYVGKTDIEFWGITVGSEYAKNDSIVKAKRKPFTFVEPIFVQELELTDEFIFLKYPRFAGRTMIGIAGMCFPVSYYEKAKRND